MIATTAFPKIPFHRSSPPALDFNKSIKNDESGGHNIEETYVSTAATAAADPTLSSAFKNGLVKAAGIACLAVLAGCTAMGPTSFSQDLVEISNQAPVEHVEMSSWRKDASKLNGPAATKKWVGQQVLQKSLKHHVVDGYLLRR